MTSNMPTRIGVAVVEADAKFLIGFRSHDQSLAGRAEFPGGKCKNGESFRMAAERECLEETGLRARSHELLDTRQFEYEHDFVEIEFWLCDVDRKTELHGGFRWVSANELAALNFPEANTAVLQVLKDRFLTNAG